MNRTIGYLTLVVALSLPAAGEAQHPQTRRGFGISFGLGAGSASSCDGRDELGGTAFSGYLRLGGYITPSIFLTGETNGWVGGSASDELNAASMGAIMAAASAGAGCDLRLGRNVALTPCSNYLQQFGGTLTYAGGIDTGVDAKVHLFQFGLRFTWF